VSRNGWNPVERPSGKIALTCCNPSLCSGPMQVSLASRPPTQSAQYSGEFPFQKAGYVFTALQELLPGLPPVPQGDVIPGIRASTPVPIAAHPPRNTLQVRLSSFRFTVQDSRVSFWGDRHPGHSKPM